MKKTKVIAALMALAATIASANDGLSDASRAWLSERSQIVFACPTSYPSSEYADACSGEYAGMSIELIRWIATEYGFSAAFLPMTLDAAQDAVLSGSADAIAGLFKSDERELRFDFSSVVLSVPASIFVKIDGPAIHGAADLAGKRVVVQRGDNSAGFLSKMGVRFEPVYADGLRSALSLVASGAADAMIGEEQIALNYVMEERLGDRIRKLPAPLYTAQDCIAVAKGDAMLLSVLNAGIDKARATGTLATIHRKWLGAADTVDYGSYSIWRTVTILVTIVAIAIALAFAHRSREKSVIAAAKAELQARVEELEKTADALRGENEKLASANARLRRDIEERSRLEEDKRRIDAETSARRVEELTRCAIASAIDTVKTDSPDGYNGDNSRI